MNINRRVGQGVFLVFCLLNSIIVGAAEQGKPNIVMILVDDMGYSDIGAYGGEIETPNLDKLANNGIRFTQMHNTAKCFPSRAALLTGLYAQQNGMHKRYRGFKNSVTLGEVLKSAGYRTLMSGKHHSAESLYDRGFDRVFGLLDGATNHFNPGIKRAGEVAPAKKTTKGRLWNIDDKKYRPYTPPEKDFYSTDYYTKYALDYLEEYKNEDNPFFLYLAYTAPHDPLHAWPEDIQKYQDTYKVGYEKIRQARWAKMKSLGVVDENMALSAATHKNWDALSLRMKNIEARKMAVYAAMIDRLDQNIGQLIAKLKALGKYENTLIVFASDNGSSAESAEKPGNKQVQLVEDGNDINLIGTMGYWASLKTDWANVSNTPLRFYKTTSYSGGTNTPFIVHWPQGIKKKQGSINHSFLGHFVDLMPTLLDITGAEYPKDFKNESVFPLVGESILPQLLGKESKRQTPLYWQWAKGSAIQIGDWKAIDNGKGWQLFNMQTDRSEIHNLAAVKPAKLTELVNAWQAWYQSTPAGQQNQ